MNTTLISYGLAAIAFAALCAMVLSRRGPSRTGMLLAASLVSALWAGLAAMDAYHGQHISSLTAVVELLRDAAWLYFLLDLVTQRQGIQPKILFMLRVAGYAMLAYCALLIIRIVADMLAVFPGPFGVSILDALSGGAVSRVILAVMGMALVEQLFRSTRSEDRWSIKYLCFGLGGVLVYDFYLYSDAMLFQHIDAEIWAGRGIVNALAVPLIAISAKRNPNWDLRVTVSRRLFFHTAALLGAGVYLLVMAGAGYYIRAFGGEWSSILQAAFLFGAFVILLSILFSGTLRARVRVFLSKHFFSYTYDYRDEWLNFTRILSQGNPGEQLGTRAIQAVAGLVESQSGALWLARDPHRFTRIVSWNLQHADGEEPADGALAAFLTQREWVINLDEYRTQPELYEDLQLPAWISAIPDAWLVAPLLVRDKLIGFMIIGHSLGKIPFNWEVSDLVKTAARQAAANLAQMEAAEALTVARQFESFNRMAAFVVHDLKNLIAQQSLLVSNAGKYKHNPEFVDDMISTVDSSVARMNRLLQQLKGGRPAVLTAQKIELGGLLSEIIGEKHVYRLKPALQLDAASIEVGADRESLKRVLGHILQNALEATPYDGHIEIHLSRQSDDAVINITDNGCGMDDAFIRDRLFRPFDSTKGSGMGIGAYECREYIRELGGRIDVTSVPGQGTTFSIHIPVEAGRQIIGNLTQGEIA
ncbi:MAG TPA: XrtA/PEP-CTERM system histidine kinase PrsK [Sulfuriferula sp.]|nr:XrtA/PEP-CTERM system histidine kinase PrsK [Sulfuriferula sp.]